MPFRLSREPLKKRRGRQGTYSKYQRLLGTACLKECHTGAILYFLGADMGGMGSMLSVKEKGDVRIWRVDSPNGETKTIEINMKDSNKY